MHIFVTGATGFVGSAVIKELVDAGHRVLGLARSAEAAEALSFNGVQVCRGSLEDPESLRKGAALADGVIHTAFIHDFTKFKESCETDRKVIETLGSELAGSKRPLIITSAIGILPPGQHATENSMPYYGEGAHPRTASEEAADSVALKGVNVSVVRLPPSVHGEGDHGFVPMLIDFARRKGVSAYLDKGLNHWPAVHRLDAARLYRLVIEKGFSGARYHAVGEEGVPFIEIAEVIGRRLNVPVAAKTPAEAAGHFEWFAHFAAIDITASSQQTREVLGWEPAQPGLVADLYGNGYFKA